MPVINTNTSAQFAQDALKANAKVQSTAMQQLATGNRINQARDDAAGLSIGQNMTSQVRGLNQAVRNVNDGINLLQTADGALVETSNMLQRMRELAVQSSNATNSVSQRIYLNNEFTSLKQEITRISENTSWNNAPLFGASGVSLLATTFDTPIPAVTVVADAATALAAKTAADAIVVTATAADTAATSPATVAALTAATAAATLAAAASTAAAAAAAGKTDSPLKTGYASGEARPADFVFQAGILAGQTISVKLDFMTASKLDVDTSDILDFDKAQLAIGKIDAGIEKVNNARSAMGATMNQLSYSADNMINISTNIAASRSTIMDTDYATASAQLAKTQIISQAATAMLTQANQQPQSVLALLKG